MAMTELMTFLVAITLLTLTPGLDTVLVIRNTTRGGWKDGTVSSFGICCGLFAHASLSAIGISVILVQSAWLFQAVKLVGAMYLIWLGISSVRSGWKAKGLVALNDSVLQKQPLDMKRSFREGFLSNILNPKTAIFYLAFLPQFIDPQSSAFLQSMILASIHFVIAMLWQGGLSFMVEKAKQWLSKPSTNAWLESISGGVMVALGLQLALSKQ